ncbi:small multi-drug export protein [Dissulfurirhabdus thermomarina]|uniref:Small multi-drug export protein n=1 Tax=Dissulfurirhabdus thermomarina TaxID=1765737 RepID=A0A6N9TRR3_DISTH|nr:small multi-drug export protein [Dissulfurirhabdus thermomarina]NDY43120.1 small multi-drug export protein [Dissulfurirhabdus thermomarina]NMX23767.1 small multi-drug export protein [Dissulfurirhabdus thermomarina]
MPLVTKVGIVVAAYLATGRTGGIFACLALGASPLAALLMALFMDFVQIPLYGVVLEASRRHVRAFDRAGRWVRARHERWQARLAEERGVWARLARHHPLAVVAVSMVPFRGCGVFSAAVLAFLLGIGRLRGTALIMAGSLLGSVLTLLVFFYPVRWLHGG